MNYHYYIDNQTENSAPVHSDEGRKVRPTTRSMLTWMAPQL